MEYKISIDKVVDIYNTLNSNKNSADGRVFCRTSARVIGSWIDKSKVSEDNSFEVCYAAATMAYYRKALKDNAVAVDLKAGDISVTDNSEKTVEYAKKLYEDALQAISHLLKSRRFAFVVTEG